jgi:hypothetical protein
MSGRYIEDLPVEIIIDIMINTAEQLGLFLKSNKKIERIYLNNKNYILENISKNSKLKWAIAYEFKDLILFLISRQPRGWSNDIDRGIISAENNGNQDMVDFLRYTKSTSEWLDALNSNKRLLKVLSKIIPSTEILLEGITMYNFDIVKNSINAGTPLNENFTTRYPNKSPLKLIRHLKLKYPQRTITLKRIEALVVSRL